jgi:hypothetical protein
MHALLATFSLFLGLGLLLLPGRQDVPTPDQRGSAGPQ